MGVMSVRWHTVFKSPAALDHIGYVKRGVPPSQVWESFLADHGDGLRALYGSSALSDFSLTEVRHASRDMVILSGTRRRGDLPVDGQFMEAYITTEESQLGAGVLVAIRANWYSTAGAMPSTPRQSWVSEAQARAIAGAAAQSEPDAPMSTTLHLSCGDECHPIWRLRWHSGRDVALHAIGGEVFYNRVNIDHLGPLTQGGLPPGASSMQAIRFRGTNVVSGGGTSQGNTSPTDGTHSFSTNTTWTVSLEGPVGSGNPDSFGRTYREELVSGVWTPVPLRRNWNSFTDPSADFSSPDAWAPNSDMTWIRPHTTELAYGWFSYWQALLGAKGEVVHRLSFIINTWGSTGIVAAQANSGNMSADANGHTTWGAIFMASGSTDDVASGHTTDGDAIVTSAHEFGHTVNNCATESGAGCSNGNPSSLGPTDPQRTAGWSTWRFSVHGSESESAANFFGNALTQFRYANSRDGVPYSGTWQFTSYNDGSDNYGSESQDTGSSAPHTNCLPSGTCPTGYVCVLTDAHLTGNPAGLCQRPCTLDTDCQTGLWCNNQLLDHNSSPITACWYNAYRNKFWDTVGTRLAFATDWETAFTKTLSAAGGQAMNATRDLITGSDNYYDRMLVAGASSRYEVTRAVASITSTTLTEGDDFTDFLWRGAPIDVRSTSESQIWWGNGVSQFPRIEDSADVEAYTFRGQQGSDYRIRAWLRGSPSGYPSIAVYRIDGSTPVYVTSSSAGDVNTGSLSQTAWYAVAIGHTSTRDWQGTIQLASGSDDFSGSLSEAYPMAHGVSVTGNGVGSPDADAFDIHVPSSSTSLTINVNATASVDVYDPSGSFYGNYATSSGSPTITISNVGASGHWRWIVNVGSGVGYTTSASLGCGSSGCDVSRSALSTRNAWGDWFAGRLPTSTDEQSYDISLSAGQSLSAAVTDADSGCGAEIVVYAPSGLAALGGLPIARWTTGSASGPDGSGARTPGGHVQAIEAGTYQVRVRPQPSSSCAHYRLYLAIPGNQGPAFPTW